MIMARLQSVAGSIEYQPPCLLWILSKITDEQNRHRFQCGMRMSRDPSL